MASTGAAAKGQAAKKKGTTLPLTAFLKPEVTSWADDDPENDVLPALPTAPTGGAGSYGAPTKPVVEPDVSRLPSRPPFKAFVGNLAYDVTAQEVGEYFFQHYQVVDVLILKHEDTGNVKGAFVEFETQDDLRGALAHNGAMLRDRAMRVDVATGKPNRDRGGYDSGRRGGNDQDSRGYGRRYDDEQPGSGDRRGFGSNDRGGFGAAFEDRRGGGMGDRGGYNRGGFDDRQDFGDRGSFEQRRGGPDLGPGGFNDRRPRDRGGFSGALEEELDAPRWGHKQQSFPPPPRAAAAAPPVAAAEPAGQPLERKRLVLAPRSKPLQEDAAATAAAEPSPQSAEKSKKSNPFGDAKPVDASARLRELEEKLAKQKAEEAAARAKEKEKEREQAAAVPVSAPTDDSAAPNMSSGEGTPGPGRGQGPPGRGHSQPGRGPAPPGSSGRGQQEQPSSSGQGPPAGAGRGQGPPFEPANGRMPPPPGMDGGRGPGRGGRRGRGREGGRGRFEYGRGRGPPPGVEPFAQQAQQQRRPPPPQQLVTRHSDGSDTSGFQEAVDRRSRGRSRGWETHTPSSAPKKQGDEGGEPYGEGDKVSKVTNIFNVLTTED